MQDYLSPADAERSRKRVLVVVLFLSLTPRSALTTMRQKGRRKLFKSITQSWTTGVSAQCTCTATNISGCRFAHKTIGGRQMKNTARKASSDQRFGLLRLAARSRPPLASLLRSDYTLGVCTTAQRRESRATASAAVSEKGRMGAAAVCCACCGSRRPR